jgi:hypothetical protein
MNGDSVCGGSAQLLHAAHIHIKSRAHHQCGVWDASALDDAGDFELLCGFLKFLFTSALDVAGYFELFCCFE